MLQRTQVLLKKGWTHTPGTTRRGAKNLAWRPKMSDNQRHHHNILANEFPRKRPNSWQDLEFRRLGLVEWPKSVGFYNSGDNFEITPEMMYRLFRRNKDESFWTQHHNERAVVHLMPLVEADPKTNMPRVDEIFRAHIARFGADAIIYNAVMQAAAFAKDAARCAALFDEMRAQGIAPTAQTFVNMMLAVRLCGEPKDKAEAYFNEAVKVGALRPVMRLDTEFAMWWDQLERLGSFTAPSGFLANKDDGAKPRPRDIFALWGWDKDERKFISRRQYVREQVLLRARPHGELYGTVYTRYRRQPWAKYRGVLRYDVRGPPMNRDPFFPDAPAPDATSAASASSTST